jgi:hypothetical protein
MTETVSVPGTDAKERRYNFALNKPEIRTVTIESQGGAATPPMRIRLQLTAKAKTPGGAMMEIRVLKAELLASNDAQKAAAAQASAALEPASALVVQMEVSNRGQPGEPKVGLTKQDPKAMRIVQQVMEPLSAALQGLFLPLPAKPIGVGAKWQQKGAGGGAEMSSNFTLTALGADGMATVTGDVTQHVKQAINDPRAGKDATIEVSVKGSYEWQTRFDRPVSKMKGEQKREQTMSAGGKGQTQSSVVRQTIETPDADKGDKK